MDRIWEREYSADDINSRSGKTLVTHLGITIEQIHDDGIEGVMPVDERTIQPYGILHGGASCVLAETLGSIASNILVNSKKSIAVGQSLTANHLRPASQGSKVKGRAKALHLGKKSHVWNIDITDEKNKLICSCRLTMAIIPKD